MDQLKLYFKNQQVGATWKNEQKSFETNDGSAIAEEINRQWNLSEEKPEFVVAEIENASKENLSTELKEAAKLIAESLNCPLLFTDGEVSEEALQKENWLLRYHGYNAGKEEYSVESLLTVGNGFVGLRGTTPEMAISEAHYPATYFASLYNEAKSMVSGQEITNEDFVNAPNLQFVSVIVDDEQITFAPEQIKELERTLDLKTGLYTAEAIVETKSGKQLHLKTNKIANMKQRNQYAIRYEVTPLNFSGTITVVSEADGGVYNYNVERYRSLNTQHLAVDEISGGKNAMRLVAHTMASEIAIVQESQLLSDASLDWQTTFTDTKGIQTANVYLEEQQSVCVEKIVFAETCPLEKAANVSGIAEVPSFTEMYQASTEAWEKLWNEAEIEIDGDWMSQKMLRLHTFHLLASGSPFAANEIDASITARGLHGEAYRGHIFWDELFILPFYIMQFPDTARELLMYRYRRLEAAKQEAQKAGFEGAMFPWQSGLVGNEQSQEIHLNPISGEWDEDHSRLQRHVSLAIAYNVWLYFENTQDQDFMEKYGLELLLEISKFWLSIAEYDEAQERYVINGVMGPDEFHEAYPGSEKGGLNNNAYTNTMVVWLFEEVKSLLAELPEEISSTVTQAVAFNEEEQAKMDKVMHQLTLEIDDEGIIAQFSGYFDLKEIDWHYYQEKYGNIHRMDRILRAEGHSADEYKVAKQADSLMLFYNFDQKRIDRVLNDLGYDLPADYLEKNLAYYLERTSHGSTLSRVVHAQLAAMVNDQELAWQLYQEALYSDYNDIQGGTTAEGIHAGVMAATIYSTLTTYGGVDIRQSMLKLQPNLPQAWQRLKFSLQHRGTHFQVEIDKEKTVIKADQDVDILFGDHLVSLKQAEERSIETVSI